MKVINKIYIDNSRFMEFIDELATQITEMNFGADTTREIKDGLSDGYATIFTDEAQEYYNEMYSEYEMMANNIMGVYNDNELNNLNVRNINKSNVDLTETKHIVKIFQFIFLISTKLFSFRKTFINKICTG